MDSIALTDHGVMFGVVDFYKECKKQEMKSINAIEFYYTDDAENKGDNYHLMAYAKNNDGWKER